MMRNRETWCALAVVGGIVAASAFYLAGGHLAGTGVPAAAKEGIAMHFLIANLASLIGAYATGLLLPNESGGRRTALPLVTWTASTFLFLGAIASEPSAMALQTAWLDR